MSERTANIAVMVVVDVGEMAQKQSTNKIQKEQTKETIYYTTKRKKAWNIRKSENSKNEIQKSNFNTEFSNYYIRSN